jgi:hypothetical protein
MQDAEGSISRTIGGMKKALAASAVVAGITAIGKAMFDLAMQTAEYADEIGMMADRTNFSLKSLQELKYVTNQLDTDFGSIQTSVKVFNNTLKSVVSGSGDASKAMELLFGKKLKVDDMKDVEKVYFDVIEKLSLVKEETKQAMLASMIFGKQYQEILPIIQAGGDEINRLRNEANDLNLVMSDDAINQARAFGDSWDSLNQQFQGTARSIGADLIPVMNELTRIMKNSQPAIEAWFHDFGVGLAGILAEPGTAFAYPRGGLTPEAKKVLADLEKRSTVNASGKGGVGKSFAWENMNMTGGAAYAEIYKNMASSTATTTDDLNNRVESLWEKMFGEGTKTYAALNDGAKEFIDSLKSQTDAFKNFVGIFDKATTDQPISMDRWLNRLKGQVRALTQYQASIKTLETKANAGVISQGMLADLQALGPAAAKQLQVLAGSTNAKLAEADKLYGQKSGIAGNLALSAVQGQMSAEAKVVQIVNNFNGGAKDEEVVQISDKIAGQIIKKLKAAGVY